jgi:hypothetical protein
MCALANSLLSPFTCLSHFVRTDAASCKCSEGVLARPSELAVNGTDLDIIFYSRQEFKWQNERREANKQRLKDWGHYPLRP